MVFLLSVLLAAATMSLCSAQCETEPTGTSSFTHIVRTRSVHANKKHGCWKDNEFHKEGETWEASGCKKCTCCSDHIDCCIDAPKPVVNDPDNCEVVFNDNTCRYEVKPKNKSGKPCTVDSYVI